MFVRTVKFVVKESIKSKAEASSVTKTKQQVRSLSKTQVIHNCAIWEKKKKKAQENKSGNLFLSFKYSGKSCNSVATELAMHALVNEGPQV